MANNLVRNIEQAQKAALAEDTNKVIQNLDQFIAILQRDRGEKIIKQAYQTLFYEATSLKVVFN